MRRQNFVFVLVVGLFLAPALTAQADRQPRLPSLGPALQKQIDEAEAIGLGRYQILGAEYQTSRDSRSSTLKGIFKIDTKTGAVWILDMTDPVSGTWRRLDTGPTAKKPVP